MSQEDDDFMYDDDEEYDLDYSTESNEEPDVDLENQYYNSKALKEEDPDKALESFQRVLDLEGEEKGEWGFKALKQMIKIHFKRGHFELMMQRYKQLLTYIKSAVTRNYSEKSINSILDHISSATVITNASPGPYSLLDEASSSQEQQDRIREQKDLDLLQEFYQATLQALKEAKNERLWFKTNTKLGKLYFDRGDYGKIFKIIRQLHQSCQTDDGEDDLKKGTQLLEIYALEIQVHTAQKNDKKLKSLYESCLHIKSAIPHPLIMGVIRECGGKMHLREHEFERAHTDFFEAFKNYDESGSPRRMACLKYLVLANMLMKSGINPFDSQEAKPYKNDPEVTAMTDLVTAYQNDDIVAFEAVLKRDRDKRATTACAPGTGIMDDPFIREHVRELLRNVRTQVLLKLVQPYTRVRIDFIARRLNVEPGSGEVEELLIALILDGTLPRGCRIDQIDGILELVPHHSETGTLMAQSQNIATDKGLEQEFDPKSPHYNGDRECTKQYLDVDISKYCAIQRLTDRLAEFQQILFNKVV